MYRVYQFQVTTPPSTEIATPLSTAWPLDDGSLISVNLIIPPGHNGLTGFRILMAEQEILPWGSSGWIIGNDRNVNYPVNTEISGTELAIQTYNTDIWQHTHYLEAVLDPLGAVSATSTTVQMPIASVDLSGTLGV